MNSSRTLIITGMHRCGTSFTANWLQAGGLFVGDKLAGATPSNKKGHFEDIEFLELHEQFLRANDETMYMSTEKELTVPNHLEKVASELCSQRNTVHDEWGFKQPRATLFLDFWNSLLPGANYIFLVRNPLSVVNSLLRRESAKLLYKNDAVSGPMKQQDYLANKAHHAAEYDAMYALHCNRVMKFANQIENERFLILDFDRISSMEDLLKEKLRRWNYSFSLPSYESLFESEMLISEKAHLVGSEVISKESAELYDQLKDSI